MDNIELTWFKIAIKRLLLNE